jgi:hypothetical protein
MNRHASRLSPAPETGAVAGLVTVLTLGTAFALGAAGIDWAWVVYPLGFGGLLPLAVGAARHRSETGSRDPGNHGRRTGHDEGTDEDAALARLRERYANDELDEREFEARLERLLLTEDADGAREYAAGREAESREPAGEPSDRLSGN